MYYLVIVDHNSMAVHLTRNGCEGLQEGLYIHCNGWVWWYVVEWLEEDGDVRSEYKEDEGIDWKDGDSDTDW